LGDGMGIMQIKVVILRGEKFRDDQGFFDFFELILEPAQFIDEFDLLFFSTRFFGLHKISI